MTTQTKLEQAKRQNFLQRMILGRQEPNPVTVLENLMDEIAKAQFSPLIDLNLVENKTSQENRDALKDSLERDFKNWLIQSMDKADDNPGNGLIEMSHVIDPRLREKKVREFLSEARGIFLNFSYLHPRMELYFPSAIGSIVSAVQDTALSVPMRLYRGENKISRQTRQALNDILQRMEEIRDLFSLTLPLDIAHATDQMQRELARAGEYVWLPLKSLVTSPLENEELDLYARERESVTRLAYQIMKGNGVILITGYRGVGKSTFVNAALMREIAEAEKRQAGEIQWKVIPIQINIAKAASVDGALRLCIRAIYRKFRQLDSDGTKILTEEEKKHIGFANLRASYKVNMSQAEALSKARSLEMAYGFRPGDLFVNPIKFASLGIFPNLDYKSSKVWNEKMDRSISLLDYDEERAEEDIVQFVTMLSRPRDLGQKQVKIKLVFVFDELDKMEAESGQEAVIRQLKNLFLTRHAVFILVTSKEFYYVLLNDRKKEDSILGSYFSSVITVPMFTAEDTTNLLKNMMLDAPDDNNAKELISRLAHYLTFQARGLPREIVRELRGMQQWVEGTLQPYLSDRTIPSNIIQLYKALEEIVENLDIRQGGETSSASQDSLNKERIWLNEGRKEQIRRGCYILLEELVNQGLLEFETRHTPTENKPDEIYDLYAKNFTTVSHADFLDIYSELGNKLAAIRLDEYPEQAFFTFKKELVESGETVVIIVENLFYTVTGLQAKKTERTSRIEAPANLTPEQIVQRAGELLAQGGLFSTRSALNYLEQLSAPNLPTDIQDKLFDIFLNFSDLSYRLDAGRYISPKHFQQILQDRYPAGFLAAEANEQVLKAFISLTTADAEKKKNSEMAKRVMRDLLNRNFEKKNPLSNTFFHYLIIEIQKLIPSDKSSHDTRDATLLEQILQTLSRSEPIPDSIVPALIGLANMNEVNLPILLLERRFTALKTETLMQMFFAMSKEQTAEVWSRAHDLLSENTTRGAVLSLAKQMSLAAMLQLVELMPETMNVVEDWLSSKDWAQIDDEILQELNNANPKLAYELEGHFKSDPASKAGKKIQALIKPVSRRTRPQPEHKSSTTTTTVAAASTAPSRYSNPAWLNILLGAAVLAGYVLSPYDIPSGLTTLQLLAGRGVQALGLVGLVVSVILGIAWLIDRKEVGYLGTFIIGSILTAAAYAVLIWYWKYPLTVKGQFILFGILLGILVVPVVFQWIMQLIVRIVRARNAK